MWISWVLSMWLIVVNDRIMGWMKGGREGNIIVGGKGEGKESNQLSWPVGLSFDRHGNLYVVDYRNDRVQKFKYRFKWKTG